MQVWAWSLRDSENHAYGGSRSVCSASLSEGESRIFASREEAEAHLREWLSAEIRKSDVYNALNEWSVRFIVDAAILSGKAEYGNGCWIFSDVMIYTLSV